MQYVGITLGPIVETMEMTSAPAGLWFSSYFFSTIVRDLCGELQSCGREILTLPKGYRIKEQGEDHGIGTYHDRIYYMAEGAEDALRRELEEAFQQVLACRAKEMAEAFRQEDGKGNPSAEEIQEYLHRFLQFHYVIFDETEAREKGIARTLADALDGLELSQSTCLLQDQSFIRRMIRGTQKDNKAYLRHYPPLREAARDERFPLARTESGKLRFLELIDIAQGIEAQTQHQGKTANYFAIVQCDGDSMGKMIASEPEVKGGKMEQQRERIQEFSRLCMEYTTSSAELVTDYGGVVIYAGGDDLLFLAPIQCTGKGTGASNIWELCRAIGRNFDDIFRKADGDVRPTISIGMSIQYCKFPLYEAFRDARNLLFGNAKGFSAKNNVSIHLRKASGQSIGLTCRMETSSLIKAEDRLGLYDRYLEFLHAFYQEGNTEDPERNLLMHSIIYHLEEQKTLFREVMEKKDPTVLRQTFDNVFDNPGQSFGQSMLKELATLAIAAQEAVEKEAVCCADASREAMNVLTGMLRLSKFMVEEESL